jgi:glyoxylase-like metal-dependent hydrolase (beta-lactamase superfamily II)
MSLRRSVVTIVLAAACTPAFAAAFGFSTLSPGVHLVSPADPGDRKRTNVLVVEQAQGLVVVNAQPSPDAAREMLTLLGAKLPGRKVRTLVLTHPHADAAGGASAFPGDVLVIVAEGAALDLADPAYDFGAEMRAREGEAFREPPRPQIGLRIQGPSTLDDPERPVMLIPQGAGHSAGDLVVDVAAADLSAVGSLLFEDRNPWAGTANVGGWIAQMNNLASSGRARFVPLHGPPVTAQTVRKDRETLAWTRGEIDAAFVDRTPVEQMPARILASPRATDHFDLGASPSFARGVVEQAVREAVAQRRKFGLP